MAVKGLIFHWDRSEAEHGKETSCVTILQHASRFSSFSLAVLFPVAPVVHYCLPSTSSLHASLSLPFPPPPAPPPPSRPTSTHRAMKMNWVFMRAYFIFCELFFHCFISVSVKMSMERTMIDGDWPVSRLHNSRFYWLIQCLEIFLLLFYY